MKQAAKKQLLNAQKVDGAIISEENGTIAFRKAPVERYRGYLRTA